MKNNAGFTLVEMMIVVVVVTILSAVSIPSFYVWNANHRAAGAAREILGVMRHARLTAVNQASDVVVVFTKGVGSGGTYRAFVDNDSDDSQDSGEQIIGQGRMPDGINMFDVNFASTLPLTTSFDAMGLTILRNGTVKIRNRYGREYHIVLNNGGNSRVDKI